MAWIMCVDNTICIFHKLWICSNNNSGARIPADIKHFSRVLTNQNCASGLCIRLHYSDGCNEWYSKITFCWIFINFAWKIEYEQLPDNQTKKAIFKRSCTSSHAAWSLSRACTFDEIFDKLWTKLEFLLTSSFLLFNTDRKLELMPSIAVILM